MRLGVIKRLLISILRNNTGLAFAPVMCRYGTSCPVKENTLRADGGTLRLLFRGYAVGSSAGRDLLHVRQEFLDGGDQL